MFDAKKLLDQFLGSQIPGLSGSVKDRAGQAGDLARNNPWKTGAVVAALLGTKTGRKLAGNVATVGGLAAIAGLGYLAYKNYQSGQSPQTAPQPAPQAETPLLPPPADSPFSPQSSQLSNDFALTLVRAMIAAAKADGHVDGEEQKRILGKLSENGLDPDEVAFLTQELTSPLDIDKVVKGAANKEEAVEIYAASLIAITADHPAERAYLDMLAARLGLEPELARTIEHTIEGATV